MTEFCALRAKAYSFLIDEYTDVDYEKNKIVNNKPKGTKKMHNKMRAYVWKL